MIEVTLEEVLARSGALRAPVGCWLVMRVADAMSSARAPMPHEVILANDGSVRLAALTGPLRFAYVAPEIAEKAKQPTPRSAVFALAALLVEAVTGRSPFARGTDLATRLAAAQDVVPPLAGRVAEATPGLDAILARALSKGPVERYGSPHDLAAALDRHVTDELHDVGPAALARAIAPAFAGMRSDPPPSKKRASKPEPAPEPSPPVVPAEDRAAAKVIEAAELDLKPAQQAQPAQPAFEVRPAERPRAAETRQQPPRRAVGVLDVDERALRRDGPKTMVGETPATTNEPNWILRIVAVLVLLLVLAVVYQYLLRPYLLGMARASNVSSHGLSSPPCDS